MCRAAAAAHSRDVREKPSTSTEGSASTVNDIHDSFARQGLVRPQEGRVLGGVIAGLGHRFGIAPWPARLLFVLLLMVIPGSQILVYPLLWVLMPSEETVTVEPSRITSTRAV
jgi:phage shock protein C